MSCATLLVTSDACGTKNKVSAKSENLPIVYYPAELLNITVSAQQVF